MRVIAGQWRGRPLVAPKGDVTRPTADRTREALFSMLTARLGDFEGLSVGDFFAGSGALGIEALSRGAASCLFVEQDRAALDALRANLAKLEAKGDVRASSVMALGPARGPLDLILMDPPYGTGRAVSRSTSWPGLAGLALAPGSVSRRRSRKRSNSRASPSTPRACTARRA